MSTAAEQIRFENLLDLAKYAFKAGAFDRAEMHLAEARVLVAHERRMEEEAGA